ncbi:MAG: glycosyltransferase [Dysgonomonas sp.]
MKRRSVALDLRILLRPNNGFGQLAINYGNYILNNPDKIADLDITLFVPKNYVGAFGDHVKYLEIKSLHKWCPFSYPHFDIWHSTTQVIKYLPTSSDIVRIITVHDLNVLYEKGEIIGRKKLKKLQSVLDTADVITAISRFTIKELERNISLRGKLPIHNYVGKKSIVDDLESEPSFIHKGKRFFFTIGQMLEKKNFHVLLDLMKLMPEYDLYICGEDTFDYAQNIKKRIEEENISNVFVPGMITPEEKVWMYRNCYAFLFPSKFEGFGLPIIEAMSFGKPVFSSNCSSLPEVGDKYAFFWDNFEPEHMKYLIDQNIEKFYANDQYIKEEIDYACSFTIERHMERYLDLYRSVSLKKRTNIFKGIYNYYKFRISRL